MHELANGNSRICVAQRLYRESYPDRRCPRKYTFVVIYQRFGETGCFQPRIVDRGRERYVRTAQVKEQVFGRISEEVGRSI